MVDILAGWGTGPATTGLIIAAAFLIVGMFIDAIPAIIILGTVLFPVAQSAGIHPVHFDIIGVVSLAFGLVTPPYGLCLLISAAVGGIRLSEALRDVCVILLPMLGVLLIIILMPDLILALPRWLMPRFL